jgi:DNA-binding transcriptional ArsR family regulator
MLEPSQTLFGSESRTRILLSLQLLGESYPSELAALLELRLFSVQSAIHSLEREGLVTSRNVGRTRAVTLNPRYFALHELQALLARLATNDPPLMAMFSRKRRRPRKAGKPGGL